MVAYTFYEADNRVRRYAEALAQRGDRVDVVVLRRDPKLPCHEKANGVHVYRIQKRTINERTKLSYLFRLLRFLINSALFLTGKHLKRPYDLIHVHSVPDFEVFAALMPKVFGAKIILDIHDILPELYASKFNVSHKSLVFKSLIMIEKASTAFSHHVIIANHLWEKTLAARSVRKEKLSVFLNYPDRTIFRPRPGPLRNDKFIVLYPGTLNWHQGLDVAIRSFAIIRDKVPQAEFHIYGEGPQKTDLIRLTRKLGLEDRIIFKDFLPIEEIADAIGNAHLGVVPKRKDSFGNEAFSTKIFEFMSMGVPVIAANTKVDKYYFDDSMIQFFESGDENDLARCFLELMTNRELRERLSANGLKHVEENSWDAHKQRYFDLVDSLCKQ